MRRTRLCLAIALLALGCLSVTVAAATAPVMPSCAAGPSREGDVIRGTPCADIIVAPPGVETVSGGAGDDTIVPAAVLAAAEPSCPGGRCGVGSQTFEGGPGDDVVYGERGNDRLFGGEGNDQLFGGIGDDLLRGGPGNDRLAGGFGADAIDGEGGDDYVRGDGTVDTIVDSGGGGNDTLSYATGITPGFTRGLPASYPGFPGSGGERGVYLDLGANFGDDGIAPFGGGVDNVAGADFETIVGTPFSDYVQGTAAAQTIYGGGGADVIRGEGGADQLDGGADGDYVNGGSVLTRDTTKISAGLMAPGATGYSQLYLTASSLGDTVTATYAAGPPASVTFTLGAASAGRFDTAASAQSGCGTPTSTQLVCALGAPLDSIVIAGMGGNDVLAATGFPSSAAVVVIGGDGADSITGGEESEDVLVDGPGFSSDTLEALGRDDALLHNGGADHVRGGTGNDLFLSNSLCDGNELDGGEGRDNASWTKYTAAVEVSLASGLSGEPSGGTTPTCAGGATPGSLLSVEDLEGTSFHDYFYGSSGDNQLLGHFAPDSYFAGAGADTILANSEDADAAIDCGPSAGDVAIVDEAKYGDPEPVECETVEGAEPGNFELPPEEIPPPVVTPPGTTAPSSPGSPQPSPQPEPPPASTSDTVLPRTRLLAHPRALLTTPAARRRVVVRFASSEPGSRFRCSLDRRPFRACASPRAYLVARGRHIVRVVAIDRAGNADPTPARFAFRVRRR